MIIVQDLKNNKKNKSNVNNCSLDKVGTNTDNTLKKEEVLNQNEEIQIKQFLNVFVEKNEQKILCEINELVKNINVLIEKSGVRKQLSNVSEALKVLKDNNLKVYNRLLYIISYGVHDSIIDLWKLSFEMNEEAREFVFLLCVYLASNVESDLRQVNNQNTINLYELFVKFYDKMIEYETSEKVELLDSYLSSNTMLMYRNADNFFDFESILVHCKLRSMFFILLLPHFLHSKVFKSLVNSNIGLDIGDSVFTNASDFDILSMRLYLYRYYFLWFPISESIYPYVNGSRISDLLLIKSNYDTFNVHLFIEKLQIVEEMQNNLLNKYGLVDDLSQELLSFAKFKVMEMLIFFHGINQIKVMEKEFISQLKEEDIKVVKELYKCKSFDEIVDLGVSINSGILLILYNSLSKLESA